MTGNLNGNIFARLRKAPGMAFSKANPESASYLYLIESMDLGLDRWGDFH